MGILARKHGEEFVITSDRTSGDAPTNRPPKKLILDVYQIWTGQAWSSTMSEAKTFASLDTADDYVRANLRSMMA